MNPKQKSKQMFKNLIAFFLCFLMVFQTLAEPMAVYAADYVDKPVNFRNWSTVKQSPISLTGGASYYQITKSDMQTYGTNGTVDSYGYDGTGSAAKRTFDDMHIQAKSRVVYQKIFSVTSGMTLSLAAGVDSGENTANTENLAWSVEEWDENGNFIWDSGWLYTYQSYTIGSTTQGDTLNIPADQLPSRSKVKYVTIVFRRTTDDGLVNGGGNNADITAAEIAEMFPNLYICSKPFVYTISNDGTSSTVNRTGLTAITPLEDQSKTGYTFHGWKVTSGSTLSNNWMNGNTYTTEKLNGYMSNGKFYNSLFGDVTFTASYSPNVYTITLNNQSATTAGTTAYYEKYNTGNYTSSACTTAISSITVPKKTGYTFGGYYTGTGGTGTQYIKADGTISSTKTTFTANDTLYAKWTVNSYSIQYNANGGTTSATAKTVAYGAAVDLSPTASKSGYTFIGWSTSSTARIPLSSYSMPAGNVTLYAVYSIEVSDIENHDYPSYSATAGISNDEVYLLVWITASPSVYKFYPLTYSKDVNTMVYRYTLSTTDISSFVNGRAYSYQLVVYDNAGNYTVLYKGGGAGDTQPKVIVKPEYTQTVNHYKYNPVNENWILFDTAHSLVVSGKTFTPAYVTPPTGYSASSKDAGGTVTAAKTYSAYYRPNTYTITFNANGGSVTPATQTVTYDNYYGTLPMPNRTGYTFLGWNTAANGTGTTVNAGDLYKTAGNQTLYAQWKANIYEIKLDSQGAANGGTGVYYQKYDTGNFTTNACTASISKITVPVRTGYTFGGYYTDKGGAGTQYIDAAGNILSTKTTFTENTTLYAKWTANTYTVKYNANGGSGTMADTVVTYDTTVKLLSNLYERTGYTFKGWATTANGTAAYTDKQSIINLSATAGAVINLYAVWNINSYAVTYDYWTNGGTSAEKNETDVNYGAAIDLSVSAEKGDGFTFIGWNTDASATTGLTSIPMGTEPVKLYAIFKKDIALTLVERYGENTIETVLKKTIYNNTNTADFVISERGSFDGWNNKGWSDATEADASIVTSTGATYSTSDSITLYALYVSDVTVSYDTNGSAVEYDSVTLERFYNASGDFLYPAFRIAKAPVLSLHSFDKWVAEDGTKYMADMEAVIEKDTLLTARWDKYPELSVSNRYFTLEQAKRGEITQAELLKKVEAVDREDGMLVNGTDVVIKDYNAERFMNMTTDSQVEITYKATDSFGNVVTKSIIVTVTDTTMRKTFKKSYVRFISSDFWADDTGNLLTADEGGLEENSIWRTNPTYRSLLQRTVLRENQNTESYLFTSQDIQWVKEYTNTNGTVLNAVDDFLEFLFKQRV